MATPTNIPVIPDNLLWSWENASEWAAQATEAQNQSYLINGGRKFELGRSYDQCRDYILNTGFPLNPEIITLVQSFKHQYLKDHRRMALRIAKKIYNRTRFDSFINVNVVYVMAYLKEQKEIRIPVYYFENKSGEINYIDMEARIYKDWSHFLETNVIEPSLCCYPVDGRYGTGISTFDSNSRPTLSIYESPSCGLAATGVRLVKKALTVGSYVLMAASIVAGVGGSKFIANFKEIQKVSKFMNATKPYIKNSQKFMQYANAASTIAFSLMDIKDKMSHEDQNILAEVSLIVASVWSLSADRINEALVKRGLVTMLLKPKCSVSDYFNLASSIFTCYGAITSPKTAKQIFEQIQSEYQHSLIAEQTSETEKTTADDKAAENTNQQPDSAEKSRSARSTSGEEHENTEKDNKTNTEEEKAATNKESHASDTVLTGFLAWGADYIKEKFFSPSSSSTSGCSSSNSNPNSSSNSHNTNDNNSETPREQNEANTENSREENINAGSNVNTENEDGESRNANSENNVPHNNENADNTQNDDEQPQTGHQNADGTQHDDEIPQTDNDDDTSGFDTDNESLSDDGEPPEHPTMVTTEYTSKSKVGLRKELTTRADIMKIVRGIIHDEDDNVGKSAVNYIENNIMLRSGNKNEFVLNNQLYRLMTDCNNLRELCCEITFTETIVDVKNGILLLNGQLNIDGAALAAVNNNAQSDIERRLLNKSKADGLISDREKLMKNTKLLNEELIRMEKDHEEEIKKLKEANKTTREQKIKRGKLSGEKLKEFDEENEELIKEMQKAHHEEIEKLKNDNTAHYKRNYRLVFEVDIKEFDQMIKKEDLHNSTINGKRIFQNLTLPQYHRTINQFEKAPDTYKIESIKAAIIVAEAIGLENVEGIIACHQFILNEAGTYVNTHQNNSSHEEFDLIIEFLQKFADRSNGMCATLLRNFKKAIRQIMDHLQNQEIQQTCFYSHINFYSFDSKTAASMAYTVANAREKCEESSTMNLQQKIENAISYIKNLRDDAANKVLSQDGKSEFLK